MDVRSSADLDDTPKPCMTSLALKIKFFASSCLRWSNLEIKIFLSRLENSSAETNSGPDLDKINSWPGIAAAPKKIFTDSIFLLGLSKAIFGRLVLDS